MVTDQYPDLRKNEWQNLYTYITFDWLFVFYFANTAPPTYEECMFGADIRDADDMENVDFGAGSQFNPRYLTYAAN